MLGSDREWLEVDGLGGFASGAIDGLRRRRYHALLQVANREFTARFVLVNGFEVHLVTPTGRYPLSSQAYSPGVISPDSRGNVVSFDSHPWPTWRLRAANGIEIVHEIMIRRGIAATVARWRIEDGSSEAYLSARPLISGRDAHALHSENLSFDFEPEHEGDWWFWRPYDGVPGIALGANATYTHDPKWYRNFRYEQDLDQGHDFEEDLAAPGVLTWDLSKGDAVVVMAGVEPGSESTEFFPDQNPAELAGRWKEEEQARRSELRPDRVRLEDYLVEQDGVSDVEDDFEEGKREMHVIVDDAEAARLGLTVADVAQSVFAGFEGSEATVVREGKEELKVRVMLQQPYRDDVSFVEKLRAPNASGRLIAIGQSAVMRPMRGLPTINHYDGERVVTVGALITMAAHLEGKGASVLDFTGFAQKFGTVLSFIRLASSPAGVNQVRIDQGAADAVIGCDLVASSSPKASACCGLNFCFFSIRHGIN